MLTLKGIKGKALAGLRQALDALLGKPPTLRVGVAEGATNEDGDSVAEYAAYNEYGTATIPPRSFLRSTIAEQHGSWSEMIKGDVSASIRAGRFEGRAALEKAGRQAQVDIQAKIMSNVPPPNAPATAARKARRKGGGYSGTIFDTGALHKSIQYEIED